VSDPTSGGPYDAARLSIFSAPAEYSSWQHEQMSWKESCFLHAGLSMQGAFRVSGPDAGRMFSDMSVNSVGRVRVGGSTHLIMCGERGRIVGHGMLLRENEQQFYATVHPVHVKYAVETGKYDDVAVEDLMGKRFLFQISGPRSLEVVESALGEDLHDIRFLRHRTAPAGSRRLRVAGGDLRVVRIGMTGTLAYEVHGDMDDAEPVYNALMAAGEPLGMRPVGTLVYLNTLHTETGYPNEYVHFPPAFGDDPAMSEFLERNGLLVPQEPHGSMGPDLTERYVTPYDIGWGHMVRFDHEFPGRAALERVAAAPPRRLVTLVWDADDVTAVTRALLGPGPAPQVMDLPADNLLSSGRFRIFNDKVLEGTVPVGVSMGRMYSWYYRTMISLASVAVEHAVEGAELTVLWGDPGSNQREIRATVARYPYSDLQRNEQVDVSTIPCLAASPAAVP
jgi:glycine cleavage system aminomethyltransferase T